MEIRKYSDKDLDTIMSWFKERHIPMDPGCLPKLGFIVPDVAAGFLIETNTKSCILEPFIANPKSGSASRNFALNAIMGDLINAARTLGYTHIFGFASHRGMVSRALSWGFMKVEDSVTVCKELK